MGHLQKLSAAVSLKAACQVRAAAEHWLLPGENENVWQAKVTRGLCLYKASIAGPSEHSKVIKHFVITRYINSQQSSGITFPPPTLPLCVACVTWFSPGTVSNPNGVCRYWKAVMWKAVGPLLNLKEKLYSPYWQVKEDAGEEAVRKSSGRL